MRQILSEEDVIRTVYHKYEIPEEKIKALLASGVRGADVEKGALYSILAEKEIEDVLALRRLYPWTLVQKKLGLTAALYEERLHHHQAEKLHRFYGIDTGRAETLLKEGYPQHWIRLAFLLEEHTAAKAEDILAQRTKDVKWKPWAEEHLAVHPDDFTRWIEETRNPALKPKNKTNL